MDMRTMHEHKGRFNYCQHGPHVKHIYRILIQQRLLVKFSCELPTSYLLKRFTCCVIIGLCDQWLPQQQNLTTFGDFALCELLITYSLSSSMVSSTLKVKKIYSWALGLKGILARQRKLSWLVTRLFTHVHQSYLPCVDVVDRYF